MRDNYSKIVELRKNNSCLFENVGIQCNVKGKLKTEKNHLIPRASYLERIANQGKVLIYDFENKRYKTNRGKLIKRNIKNANKYHVFCGNHDKYLFDEMENGKKFDESNKKQLFQFSLRAFTFSISEQMIKKHFNSLVTENTNKVADVHLQLNNERLELYKKAVINQDWDSIDTKIIKLNQKIDFISCFAGTPNYGIVFPVRFTNAMISFNTFPEGEGTIILLSYLKKDKFASDALKYCNKLEKLSIKNQKKFLTYMNKFIVAFDHNIAINPTFWKNLNEEDKQSFYEIAHIFPKSKSLIAGLRGHCMLKLKKKFVRIIS